MADRGRIRIRLGDVCAKIGSGATPRGGASVYLDADHVALIRSQNVHNDGFRFEGLVYISDEHAEQLGNVEVRHGDVLLNITGDSVARCCQVPSSLLPARVNQHVSIIRPEHSRVNPRFLRYLMVSPQIQARLLSWAAAGGTRNALTKGMVESLEVSVPEDVVEQQAIACILGALDDKIELNRRMNETLEAMARALFKSWFVDFCPVRAKAAGRQAAGLAPHIADLFPDGFEESELGEIPKGWSMGHLGRVADVSWGDTNTTKDSYTPTGFIAYSAKGPDGLLPYHDHDRTGVVVSAIGANSGTTWLAIGRWSCIKNTIRFWATDNALSTEYLYHATLGKEKWPMRGSAQPFISQGDARTLGVLIPAGNLAHYFADVVRPCYAQAKANSEQSQTLASLRDTLLPKLISGELRVPDAEGIVGWCA